MLVTVVASLDLSHFETYRKPANKFSKVCPYSKMHKMLLDDNILMVPTGTLQTQIFSQHVSPAC